MIYATRMKQLLFAVLLFALTVIVLPAKAATCCTPFPTFPNTQQLVLGPPAYTDAVVLVASTAQSTAVPAGANWVILSANCNFFARGDGTTAAVPGATTTDGSAAIQNPTAWNLRGIRSISLISSSACIVTVSYYS